MLSVKGMRKKSNSQKCLSGIAQDLHQSEARTTKMGLKLLSLRHRGDRIKGGYVVVH